MWHVRRELGQWSVSEHFSVGLAIVHLWPIFASLPDRSSIQTVLALPYCHPSAPGPSSFPPPFWKCTSVFIDILSHSVHSVDVYASSFWPLGMSANLFCSAHAGLDSATFADQTSSQFHCVWSFWVYISPFPHSFFPSLPINACLWSSYRNDHCSMHQ